MPEQEPDNVVISDASAIRALAHPARLAVMTALFEHSRVLTATQAAKIANCSPSAMSYHLRALEKAGIIKPAPDGTDGRERPWVRAGTSLVIRPGAESGGAANAATDLLLAMTMETDRKNLLDAVRRREDEATRQPLDPAANYYRTTLVVTNDEAIELFTQVQALCEKLRSENREHLPEGAEMLTVGFIVAPEGSLDSANESDDQVPPTEI